MNTLILGDVKIGPAHIGKRNDCANRFMIELAELVGARKMRVLNGDQFADVSKMVGGRR